MFSTFEQPIDPGDCLHTGIRVCEPWPNRVPNSQSNGYKCAKCNDVSNSPDDLSYYVVLWNEERVAFALLHQTQYAGKLLLGVLYQ